MRAKFLIRILAFLLSLHATTAIGVDSANFPNSLVWKIPPRPDMAMSGSEFAGYISAMDESSREQAILAELIHGNLPDFLRRLKAVRFQHVFQDGRVTTATIFVMPDYLAIGSNDDFLRIPMGLPTATGIADRFGFVLPTKKMVDTIYQQSAFQLAPEPMPAGPEMRSTAFYWEHNRRIELQSAALGCSVGSLVSGHKKDLVLTERLARAVGKVAIYGWHRTAGIPIQPLSTIHRADYADYSHGIRLVSDIILLDGKACSIYSVLENPSLAGVLSDEGAIGSARRLMTDRPQPPGRHAQTF